ncbi:MAG: M20 family metallopeptidase [Chlorobi bacterium]|nr:M20 family metallopeptidase [Chlorobiota bacterium]
MRQEKELILQELLKTIEDLIRFKTVDGNYDEFYASVEYIEKFFEGTGVFIQKHFFGKYPALFISTKETKTPEIMFQGHVDVVNGNPEQFIPKIEGDRLYGRGSVDMKGFDALALHLIRELALSGGDYDVGLMLTFDEEVGSENGASKMAELGYGGKKIFNGDGGYNFAVIHGEKGILKIKLEVSAKPGRHPYVWKGKNAFDLLIDDYRAISKLFPENGIATEDDNWHSTFSIYDVKIENDEFYPPKRAEAKMNIYFTDDLSVNQLLVKILSAAQYTRIKKITGSERVFLNPNDKCVVRLKEIMEQNFGREIIIRTENGSSDARYFTNAGAPIVIVKVVGEDFHGDNERLKIPYLLPLYDSMKEFVYQAVNKEKIFEGETH